MMRVIGFNFSKISIDKKKEPEKGMKINTNIEIKELEKKDIDVFKDKDVFDMAYEFKINYSEDIAELVFNGSILILIENEEIVKNIEENWKDKKLPENLRIPLMNVIFSRCNLKALQLEEDLGLPQHLPSPKIASQPGSASSAGSVDSTSSAGSVDSTSSAGSVDSTSSAGSVDSTSFYE